MIEPVTDKRTAEILERHLKAMIEGRVHVRKDWWSVPGRAAVAIESGMHFVESQAEAISDALKEAGQKVIFAVELEEGGENGRWKLYPTEVDLLELSKRTFMLQVAILTEDGTLVILCSPDDFIVIAGPRPFVERACGGDLEAARAAFREWAFDERLKEIASRYAEE